MKTNAVQVLLITLFLLFDLNLKVKGNLEDFDFYDSSDHFENNLQHFKHCDCYNIISDELDHECKCRSNYLTDIPKNLGKNLSKLTIMDSSNIKYISAKSLDTYRSTLKEVSLTNLPFLHTIEEGTFANIPNLRTIYITLTPQLKKVDGLLKGISSNKFYSLRIGKTGLTYVPDLSHINSENVMHLLDLDWNEIKKLPKNSIKVKAEQVTLNYNKITVVENFAFNGSQIGKLNIRGNILLTDIQENAFKDLSSLRELDVSGTSIKSIPVNGLDSLEKLKIEDTKTLTTIPSLYNFKKLESAKLTYPFLCCAFKYPERHNPSRHALFEKKVKASCQNLPLDTGQKYLKNNARKKRSTENKYIEYKNYKKTYFDNQKSNESSGRFFNWWLSNTTILIPQRGKTIDFQEAQEGKEIKDEGFFHEGSAEITEDIKVYAFCGNLSLRTEVQCYPEPNALNPCEDVMGYSWLRIGIWFVVFLTVLGNLAVIIVVVFSGSEMSVTRFLICNLSVGDLCMGCYLFLIGSIDLQSAGVYFNYAFDWQYGLGCQLAGFLTVFASQLSVFTLTLLTVERWYAITYAIYLTKRIQLTLAAKLMLLGWIYSIVVATLPLLGVSNYSSTSICLPMEINGLVDKIYISSIFLINGLAFGVIVCCYCKIYFSLGPETRRANTKGEMTIAKKMALLIFTDFITFAPVAFFALTALAGYPLIGVRKSKILLVFFYPLNSCANPYLYVILTAQYREDFFHVLYRIGISKRRRSFLDPGTTKKSRHSIETKIELPLVITSTTCHCEVVSHNCRNTVFV